MKLLKIGIFAEVYLLNGTIIRKLPRSESDEDLQPILHEATIYTILGKHPRIAECLSFGETKFVDVKYYPHGDLAAYTLNAKGTLTIDLQKKWFQHIIEAVVKIHEHDVIHSDLALRQFFLDDNLDARLGDFNSSQYPGHMALGYEKASHCLPRDYEAPNSFMSDLFALGSTLYELMALKAPYSELYHVEHEDVMHSSDHSVFTCDNNGHDGGFFDFTRGRFLVKETDQMARRRIIFDIDELASVAAKSVGANRCVDIEKCPDGLYNKAYVLTMDDGKQVIGKVPDPNAGIPHYTTASEVATMDFVGTQRTKTPAPHVYAWNSRVDRNNSVGAEFIIMEELCGIPLSRVWWTLHPRAKLKVFLQVFDYQRKWSAIQFTRFGSLYYAQDIDASREESLYIEGGSAVSNSQFAVGPATGREWSDEGRQNVQCDRVPPCCLLTCKTFQGNSALEYRKAVGLRERAAIETLHHLPTQTVMVCGGPEPLYQPTLAKKLAAIEYYLQILASLLPDDPSLTRGYLGHDNLHHENIFVNAENPTEVLGMIDWQSIQITPPFDHCLDPSFIDYNGPDVGDNLEPLKMPENVRSLHGEEKAAAINQYLDRSVMVAWRRLVQGKNESQYRAIRFQRLIRGDLLHLSRRIFEPGEAHFGALLLDLRDEWTTECGSSPEFPLKFSEQQVAEIEADTKRADLGIEVMRSVEQRLGELWPEKGVVEHERYDEAKAALRKMKAEIIDQYSMRPG